MIENILDLPEDERLAMLAAWLNRCAEKGRIPSQDQRNMVGKALGLSSPTNTPDPDRSDASPKPAKERGVSFGTGPKVKGWGR